MNDKTTLKLVTYPDPLLKKRLEDVSEFDDKLRHRVREMFRIMYENKGIGLAGNQAGLDQRLIVMNLSGDPEQPNEELVLVNPVIQGHSKETVIDEEGCLSFPEVKAQVERKASIVFSAYDENGLKLVYEADDWFARCFQHELDHINGVTFVERLTPAQKALISDRLKELEASISPTSNT